MSAPAGYDRVETQTPGQSNFLQMLMQLLGGMGMQGGQAGIQHYLDILSNKPGAFEAFEAPYKTQFQQETMPGIAEQYAGQGAMSSSAFPMAAAQAGKGLSENLAALRAQLQGGAAQGLLGGLQGLGGLGLGTQAFGFQKKAPSFWDSIAGGLGQATGNLPFMFGGGGGGVADMLKKLFAR